MFRKIMQFLNQNKSKITEFIKLKKYYYTGRKPWSAGYSLYKEKYIYNSINSSQTLQHFLKKEIPVNYGISIDERVVEYPWIFSNLSYKKEVILDAGSTFNFNYLIQHPIIKEKELFIQTYYPEYENYNQSRISYLYADLRDIPMRNNYFDVVISQSTIEHIGMDNSIYGYSDNNTIETKLNKKSFEYIFAIEEFVRVLKPNGQLLITFPFGRFENHGFFQQFDSEMLKKITDYLTMKGTYFIDFIKYTKDGWVFTNEQDCHDIISYNPHTGIGKGDDNAAHCRAVCCIKFIKN